MLFCSPMKNWNVTVKCCKLSFNDKLFPKDLNINLVTFNQFLCKGVQFMQNNLENNHSNVRKNIIEVIK